MTASSSNERDLLRNIFDALPSLVFVVDQDVRIQECNLAAAKFLSVERKAYLKKRAGEVFHCVYSNEVPQGCGRAPSCESCIIRNSVAQAFQGNRIVRRRARIEIVHDAQKEELYSLITVSPFSFNDTMQALLVVEDITELAELQRIIPICSVCGKIRDDKESWLKVESYFKDVWDMDFSHSYCPECYKNEVAKLQEDLLQSRREKE
jgi:transcriptional regulator with PAS, ATPase and Fis domain